MAELSGFWTSDDTTPEGDQVASYTQAHWSDAAAILAACSGFEGVAPGYTPDPPSGASGLTGTVTGANTVAIGLGGAVVDGKWYLNDASQDVNIPSSSGGTTRIDRIVLRATWASFNVSVYRIAGVESGGSPSAPAITQTSGTTYDIMLYQALVNDAGTVTLTDERVFASPFWGRQGGSATIWSTAGTTNYNTGNYKIQVGVGTASFTGESVDQVTVTFRSAFSYAPIGFATAYHGNSGGEYFAAVHSTSTTTMVVQIAPQDAGSKTETVYFTWLAIGPN